MLVPVPASCKLSEPGGLAAQQSLLLTSSRKLVMMKNTICLQMVESWRKVTDAICKMVAGLKPQNHHHSMELPYHPLHGSRRNASILSLIVTKSLKIPVKNTDPCLSLTISILKYFSKPSIAAVSSANTLRNTTVRYSKFVRNSMLRPQSALFFVLDCPRAVPR